jgi:pimeloyl-ACP methyl ester carboxylesterase
LTDEFTVVAWDEPGARRSSDVPGDFALADYANCLAALIDALALGPAHVAGLSWGGTVVQELYRRRPALVATLILICGHLSNLEQPEQFNEAVREFCRAHSPRWT